ncbi:MAG: dihydrolipoyl dehydrogenase [Rickettsiales bacterium]|mgnify:CR=1 FL=1|nr:dihydrolipoyl dehydrogenase [Rickettsiales bacterium]
MADMYDVAVIGAGPGGYVAAIKCAQLGLKTVCIDKKSTFGGTCLNEGCIPSKALLDATAKYAELDNLAELGIQVDSKKVNLKKLMAKKDQVVNELTQGISALFQKNKITAITGAAAFKDAETLIVTGSKKQEIKAKNFIIATGSKTAALPGVEIDEKSIVSSTGALALQAVPKNLAVIGGGYIGLEMASIWARLGSKVTVVEYGSHLVPMMDADVAQALQKSLEAQGINFKMQTEVIQAETLKKQVQLTLKEQEKKAETKLKTDVVLVAVGRKPMVDGLALDKAGVKVDERGFIEVNARYQTAQNNIYAIGDVIPGPMLAHKAEDEGIAVAELIAGQAGHVNYQAIPSVIYTNPEVASVGETEAALKEQGVDYKVGKFPFAANSRAKASFATDGFVKVLTNAKTDRVLGVHIIGAHAGDLIAEVVLGMEYNCAAEDIAQTCHAHPTRSEALREAAMAAYDKPIHR